MKPHKTAVRPQRNGFSLIEVLVAVAVVSVGIMGLALTYGDGVKTATGAQFGYVAQKKAEEAMEAIFTARDTKILKWADIQNVSNGGVFMDGPQPMLVPGPDGLVGTQSDLGSAPEVYTVNAGPDGVLGTADDVTYPLSFMTRTIQITNIQNEPNLRMITVTINYTVQGRGGQYVLVTYVSAFA